MFGGVACVYRVIIGSEKGSKNKKTETIANLLG